MARNKHVCDAARPEPLPVPRRQATDDTVATADDNVSAEDGRRDGVGTPSGRASMDDDGDGNVPVGRDSDSDDTVNSEQAFHDLIDELAGSDSEGQRAFTMYKSKTAFLLHALFVSADFTRSQRELLLDLFWEDDLNLEDCRAVRASTLNNVKLPKMPVHKVATGRVRFERKPLVQHPHEDAPMPMPISAPVPVAAFASSVDLIDHLRDDFASPGVRSRFLSPSHLLAV